MWFGPPERNTLRPWENGVVLLKPVLPEPTFLSVNLFSTRREVVSARSFYSSRTGSYNETRGPTGGLEVAETLYSIKGPRSS
jgi:hypothetical protein